MKSGKLWYNPGLNFYVCREDKKKKEEKGNFFLF